MLADRPLPERARAGGRRSRGFDGVGKIGRFTDAKRGVYQFRDSDLGKLKQVSFTTSTSWTPSVRFSGPLVRDILAKVEAKGTMVRVLAINYYRYDISVDELGKQSVVLARRIDNKPFDVAHYGPLWLMYPLQTMPDADKARRWTPSWYGRSRRWR
ncbi:Uncharacterised protein [Chromobacterium violaceum]|uniref:Uncharacterized protein n=1 Tax=Chromobacterium violaceum TaxID=536 RepID=A0A3S5DLP8_CHRVL|nr:Uncharacterised protein [Chromobacterium violaceum]